MFLMREGKMRKIDGHIVKIKAIPKEYGGGYEASLPELGVWVYRQWGKTKEESVKNLKEIYKDTRESVERLKKKKGIKK